MDNYRSYFEGGFSDSDRIEGHGGKESADVVQVIQFEHKAELKNK